MPELSSCSLISSGTSSGRFAIFSLILASFFGERVVIGASVVVVVVVGVVVVVLETNGLMVEIELKSSTGLTGVA